MGFTLLVNGAERSVDVSPENTLLSVLREKLNLTGTKYSCGEGQCGACTVLIEGRATSPARCWPRQPRERKAAQLKDSQPAASSIPSGSIPIRRSVFNAAAAPIREQGFRRFSSTTRRSR